PRLDPELSMGHPLAVSLLLLTVSLADRSHHEVAEEPLGRETGMAELAVEVEDARATASRPMPLPVRVIVTASDGTHPDGPGRGPSAGGGLCAEGAFTVAVPPGAARRSIRSGPDYEPLEVAVEAKPDHRARVRARLHRWFAPEDRGWYAGDNHVHAQHDAT